MLRAVGQNILQELLALPGALHELHRDEFTACLGWEKPSFSLQVVEEERGADGCWKTVVDKSGGKWELCFVERPAHVS